MMEEGKRKKVDDTTLFLFSSEISTKPWIKNFATSPGSLYSEGLLAHNQAA